MPIYKKVNKDFFKKWSPETAYVLGFFAADGSIDVNERGSHYFSIQICDKKLLESIKKALGSNHKISKRDGKRNEQDKYRLQIGSVEMCNDLRKLGLFEEKTKNMAVPIVPKRFIGHFVRGYFDGDGNVWVGNIHKKRKTQSVAIQTAFTSCSKRFLMQLRDRLQYYGCKGSMTCQKTYYRLSYSVLDSIILWNLMYKGSHTTLFLMRKKKVFDKFIRARDK